MKSRRKPAGISTLEMLITLPTATVLIGAMASCVTIMMRAKSQDDTLFRGVNDLAVAADRIASDLELATSHVSSSATHIEFVVPDRNDDSLPEQIRYEWGGVSGLNAHQILIKYNQEPRATLFEGVNAFSFSNRLVSVPASVPNHERGNVAVLQAMDAYPDELFRDRVINATSAIGQYFVPPVPGSGTKWDLGELRLMVRAADANVDGILKVCIMRGNTATRLPIAPVLAEVRIPEWRLGPSYQWIDIPIAPICQQAQGTPLCIVLAYGGGTGNVAQVQFIENGTGMPPTSNLVTSSDGGTIWTTGGSTRGLRFYAYGLYDGYTSQRRFLSSVDIKVGSLWSNNAKIERTVRLLATPEIP
jgi:hypothetical protein